jgi:phosphoglycolate phosphatase
MMNYTAKNYFGIRDFLRTRKYFAFDLDGTLIDSSKLIFQSVNTVRRNYGLSQVKFAFVDENLGLPPSCFWSDVSELTPQQSDQMNTALRKLLAEAKYTREMLYSGVVPLLSRIKSLGLELFLASNKPEHLSKLVLEQCEIAPFFTKVYGAGLLPPKPSPNMLVEASVENRRKTSDGVMIGDHQVDIMAASAAGMPSILIERNRPNDYGSWKPTFRVSSVEEILRAIEGAIND